MSNYDETSTTHGHSQKTFKSYVIGFLLSLVLTWLAFRLVGGRLLSDTHLYIALTFLAFTQLIVQSVCFLRLNTSEEGRWDLLPFLFVILIMAILAGGTLWIMYNLNYNMML